MNEFEVGDDVEILCWDGARFVGRLRDFDAERDYFTLELDGGPTLGFPFGDVREMMCV